MSLAWNILYMVKTFTLALIPWTRTQTHQQKTPNIGSIKIDYDDTIQCPVFPGKKEGPPSTTSTNSFVAEIIEVIIKAVCIVDSCVKLMRGPSLQQWIDTFSENAKSLYHNLPISVQL